jgi:hypothetical protein
VELGAIIAWTAVLVLGLLVLGKFLLHSHARRVASDVARQVFPVWAAQGPFHSGTESAAALRNAWLAVCGAEQTEKMANAIEKHRCSYDNDPDAWEKTRCEAAEQADDLARTLAEGIVAAQHLNKEILESGGHRIEFTKSSDGSVQTIYKQIWSDEEIEAKKKKDGEAIASGIGNGLLSNSSQEAKTLVKFLSEVYLANTDEELDARAIGRTWLAFFSTRNEQPNLPLVHEFERLNDAYSAIITPELKWSENAGCFERHLKRKHENPLFPEPDRNVTQEQIDEAQRQDQADAVSLQKKLLDLASDIAKLPALATWSNCSPIRERIDDLLSEVAGVGGPADNTRESLNSIRTALISSLREGIKDNEKASKALEEAEEYHQKQIEIAHDPFVAQMGRIPSDDVVPAMLSESPETIWKAMSIMNENTVDLVVADARDRVRRAQAEGEVIPLADEKLKAIKGNRG